MKIGIDLRHILLGDSGGIVQHMQGLLNAAFQLSPNHYFYVYCTCFNRNLLSGAPSNVEIVSLPTGDFYGHLAKHIRSHEGEVLFRTYPVDEPLDFPESRQVVFIPDIQHETFPEFFTQEELRKRRRSFNKVLSSSGAIATNSDFVRNELWKHPWTQVKDIFLATPALQDFDRSTNVTADEQSQVPKKPFFYFPANLWLHKNHRRLLSAFAEFLRSTSADMELILTGNPTGWEQLKKEFPGVPVRHLGFVHPRFVKHLYRHAYALTFFSLHEGFGMPLLEAFSLGTPVLCSNTTSLPEVGGDAVLSCDPFDTQKISELMAQLWANPSLRDVLADRGKHRLSAFTWEEGAHNLIEACLRVAKRSSESQVTTDEDDFPLVTVITPSYNQGKFLRRTIDSVVNQTYPKIQYIVMDGGSTDDSVDILKSYKDRFYWKSEFDQGQTDAINKGLQLAKGEILCYLNSDDTFLPNAIEEAFRFFRENPACDMVYGKANYTDEDDNVIGTYRTTHYSFHQLVSNNPICQPAAFWRSRIGSLVGPFDDQLHFAMDHDYWMRIDRVGGRIEHLEKVLANSRMHKATKTLTGKERIYQEIFRTCRKHAGYVSLDYYIGLWHYRAFGSENRKLTWIRRIPRGFLVIAHLHHLIDHRTPKEIVAHLKRNFINAIRHRYYPALKRRLPVVRGLAYTLSRWIPLVSAKRPVIGVFRDGYLAPVVQMHLGHRERSNPGYFCGYALKDTELILYNGTKRVLHVHLDAGKETRVELPSIQNPIIILSFSAYTVQPSGGRISFYLTETNLFNEWQAFY